MTCFCGCETYEKDTNGFKVGCTKCGHGPQNHDDGFRNVSRKISWKKFQKLNSFYSKS